MTTTPEHRTATPPEAGARPSRRAVVGAAAWAAPTITVLSAAPAFAASAPSGTSTVTETTGLASSGTGVVYLALDPAPTTAPAPVVTYTDTGTTTTSFTPTGAVGTAAVYRLTFSTTTRPVPTTITAVITIDRYGTATAPVTLQTAGTLDTRFADPALDAGAVANLTGLAFQPDGKILIAGAFTQIGGVRRAYLARLHRDGTLDTSFADPNLGDRAAAVAIQPDGKIVVGGQFATAGASSARRRGLARFHPDGRLDESFADPFILGGVSDIAIDADGRVLVAGGFTQAGTARLFRKGLARLTTTGTLDESFADPNILGPVYAIALDADGRIVVGGAFTTAGADNTPRNAVARFLPTGALDQSLGDTHIAQSAGVLSLALDDAGRIVIGGDFTEVGSAAVAATSVARLTPDGRPDPTFVDRRLGGRVNGLTLQPDGKIVVTGRFTTGGTPSVPLTRLARLAPDGSLDADFTDANLTAPSGAQTTGVVVDRDGLVHVTGTFTTAGASSQPRRHLARFYG